MTIEINDLLGKSKKYKTLQKTFNLKIKRIAFSYKQWIAKNCKIETWTVENAPSLFEVAPNTESLSWNVTKRKVL